MNITERNIINLLTNMYEPTQLFTVDKMKYFYGYESDFLYVDEWAFIHEIEIKTSVSDFKHDFTKHNVTDSGHKIYKHGNIQKGVFGLKTFSFAVTRDIVDKIEIPEYAGMYVVESHEKIVLVKEPPILENAKELTNKELKRINSAVDWRMLNDPDVNPQIPDGGSITLTMDDITEDDGDDDEIT